MLSGEDREGIVGLEQGGLADGKERAIQHMVATTFWHADGTPMSAQQFMEMLFGKLPEFFKNEDELSAAIELRCRF